MSCSNCHRAKVLNLVYRALNSKYGKDVKIKRDSLHRRYEVNRYSVDITANNSTNTDILKFLETLCIEKLNLNDVKDKWTTHGFHSPIYKYNLSINDEKDMSGKSYIHIFLY